MGRQLREIIVQKYRAKHCKTSYRHAGMPREDTADLELSRPGLFEVPQQCQMLLDHAKCRFRSVDRLKIFPDLQVIVLYRPEHFVPLGPKQTFLRVVRHALARSSHRRSSMGCDEPEILSYAIYPILSDKC